MMSLQSLPLNRQILYSNDHSPKPASIFAANRDILIADFVGLHCNKSKRTRRRIGVSKARSVQSLAANNWSSINAVLDLERVGNASKPSSNSKPKVANLEDILSERGACGVGFIAHLENKASHDIIKDALTALGCMEHRGGCGADNDSGDGSGVMTSIPWDLFNHWADEQGIASFDKLHTGVGMVFLPKDDDLMNEAKTCESLEGFEMLHLYGTLLDFEVVLATTFGVFVE